MSLKPGPAGSEDLPAQMLVAVAGGEQSGVLLLLLLLTLLFLRQGRD